MLLLEHYDAEARRLPWRAPPGTPPAEPYRVWLSEIMLQQTTVAAVIPRFERFTARWPTLAALAAADDAAVMAEWAGLGYYARARNLIACARAVVRDHHGRFPETERALRTLPGIGAYTAAAIAAIAFGEATVPIDGNVERVIARLFALEGTAKANRKAIQERAQAILPQHRPGDFAQALMDLGATICMPRTPQCDICPLSRQCVAAAQGNPAAYPAKPAKTAKPARAGNAYWIERDNEVLLVRRPPRGLLGGMLALPSTGWDRQSAPGDARFAGATALGDVAHVFTHFALTLTVNRIRLKSGCNAPVAGEWWPRDRVHDAGLPTIFAKAARLALEES